MPVDVFLTPRRYVLVIFVALCFGILIASYFAADLEDTTLLTTADVSSRLNHVNTESDRYSSDHDLGPIPGAASNHLHWFVQVSLHFSLVLLLELPKVHGRFRRIAFAYCPWRLSDRHLND